jgi:heme exporter protein A
MRLIADNISGERGGETIFSGIAFSLESGQGLVVTGPNGTGKSTLLRIVAGLLPPAEGTIRLEGGEEDASVGAACHYLGHLNGMKTALTVEENLLFWQRFSGEPKLGLAEALDAVGLYGIGHLPFGYLSTGQRRRVAVARLLLNHRPVWLLDEPTAGLDAASAKRFGETMEAHLGQGGIIIAATHLPLGIEDAQELRLGAKDAGNA